MNYHQIRQAIEAWRAEESRLWKREISVPGLPRLAKAIRVAFDESIIDEAMKDAAVAERIRRVRADAIREVAAKLLKSPKLRKAVSEAMSEAVLSLLDE